MPALEAIATGVVSSYVYAALQKLATPRLRRVAPAAFHGGSSLLREADREFEAAKADLLKRYKNPSTLKVYLSTDSGIRDGALAPLFDHLFMGKPLNYQLLEFNLLQCRDHRDTVVSRSINGIAITEILEDIVDSVLNRFALNDRLQNVTLRASIIEIKKALETIVKTDAFSSHIYTALSTISTEEVDKFCDRYLSYLSEYVKNITISGLDAVTKRERVRHVLADSFVPLTIEPEISSPQLHTDKRDTWRGNAFDMVVDTPRIILRGPAGSGKTTLLQWFVSQCDPTKSEDSAAFRFPVYVPLRRLESLHAGHWNVLDMIRKVIDSDSLLELLKPDLLEQLSSKGYPVVLLFDGVDELTEENRERFWGAIERASKDYQNFRFVITSRHLSSVHLGSGEYRDFETLSRNEYQRAVSQWKPPVGFLEFLITPLTNTEIWDFIKKWHEGVDEELLPVAERSSLKLYPSRLRDQIFDPSHEHALELSRIPLLCALVCMVHFLQNGRLPDNKRNLYEMATKLLVETRDEHRGVSVDERFAAFDLKKRMALLRRIALTMQEGIDGSGTDQAIEVDKISVLSWVLNWQEDQVLTEVSAVELLDFVIERCSIIKEPGSGRIDFIHRSFMEFLAANEIVIAREAHSIRSRIVQDQWWYTLQFCMDTATGGQFFAGTLLSEIVDFLTQKHADRRDLFVRCAQLLRYSEEIPLQFRDKIAELARHVLPPQSDTEVIDLAAVPFEQLRQEIKFDDVLQSGPDAVARCAALLSRHNDNRCKEIILTGYEGVADRSVIRSLNECGKIHIREHHALMSRLANGSYHDFVFVRPNELADRELRRAIARRIAIRFPIKGDKFVGWDRINRCTSVKFIEAKRADWDTMLKSINKVAFDSCRHLELYNCGDFDFNDLSRIFPSLETIELARTHNYSFQGMNNVSDLHSVLVAECSQSIEIEKRDIPTKLKSIVIWKSSGASIDPAVREIVSVSIEVEDRDVWEHRLY